MEALRLWITTTDLYISRALAAGRTHQFAFIITNEYTAILTTDPTAHARYGLSPNAAEVPINFTEPLEITYTVTLARCDALMLTRGPSTKPIGTHLTRRARLRGRPLATSIYGNTVLNIVPNTRPLAHCTLALTATLIESTRKAVRTGARSGQNPTSLGTQAALTNELTLAETLTFIALFYTPIRCLTQPVLTLTLTGTGCRLHPGKAAIGPRGTSLYEWARTSSGARFAGIFTGHGHLTDALARPTHLPQWAEHGTYPLDSAITVFIATQFHCTIGIASPFTEGA